MADEVDVGNWKCPLCDNPLARDDYRLAVQKMKKQAEGKASEKLAAEAESHRSQIEAMKKAHKQEMKEHGIDQKNALAEQRKRFLLSQQQLLNEVRRSSNAQLREMKKEKASEVSRMKRESNARMQKHRTETQKAVKEKDEQMTKQKREMKLAYQNDVASRDKKINTLKKELRSKHSRDLEEKDKEIARLHKDLDGAETTARKKAKLDMKEELERQKKIHEGILNEQIEKNREKDLMLERVNKELDEAKEKVRQSQPELRGEAGERDLLRILEEAFPHDHFKRQKRGTASSDLVQHVRLPSGKLGMPIVYDNKAGSGYSKTDIRKAAGYKRTHSTEYSLIVSSRPQKRTVPNGLLGEVDGVIVVHPSIVIEVAKTIREGILKIERASASQKDKDAKQARLYKYVVGHEFAEVMRSLESADKEIDELQTKEEKAHKTLWDRRKSVVARQRKAHIDLSGGIDAIIQNEVLEEPARVI